MAARRPSIYLCDLLPGLAEEELRELASRYGKVHSLEHLDDACEESALVEYADSESAEEAQRILNFASVRGKTCRCIPLDSLEAVRSSMESGQRLVIEHLDPGVDSRGLRDLCAMFGEVLDSKVELDDAEVSRGYGFAHFAWAEDVRRAQQFLGGMQVGASAVEVRHYVPADATLFSGCHYSEGYSLSSTSGRPPRSTPRERMEAASQHFGSLQYNYVEVLADTRGKLERLKALLGLYDPNQDSQVVIVASSSHLAEVRNAVAAYCEEADFEVLDRATPVEKRSAVMEGFEMGNVYVLAAASEVAEHRGFELSTKAAVLINFDLPPTLAQLQYRILKRAHSGSRVHSFLLRSVDQKLVVPLMAAMEDSGHEMPAELLEMWSDV